MAERAARPVAPVILLAGDEVESSEHKLNTVPITGYIAKPKHIPHLEYSLQWFGIGLVLVGVWGWGGYKRAQRLAESA